MLGALAGCQRAHFTYGPGYRFGVIDGHKGGGVSDLFKPRMRVARDLLAHTVGLLAVIKDGMDRGSPPHPVLALTRVLIGAVAEKARHRTERGVPANTSGAGK